MNRATNYDLSALIGSSFFGGYCVADNNMTATALFLVVVVVTIFSIKRYRNDPRILDKE